MYKAVAYNHKNMGGLFIEKERVWGLKETYMRRSLQKLSLKNLRQLWKTAWDLEPHIGISRIMLEKSLIFRTQDNLTPEQQHRLNQLVRQYKRNPQCFDEGCGTLKPGTRLIRNWKEQRHSVLVKPDGFEYQGRTYTSLSQIANDITGSRWNGWVFFGLKN